MDKVIVITGQTAVGKTELSLKVTKMFNGEIINCDASQIRKHLNIGTAKINLEKIDVTHHLIDILEPNDDFSIKDYQHLAREKIDDLIKRNKTPFLVGGSPLYIASTLGDYELNISGRDTDFEKEYQDTSNEDLHKILEALDYQSSLIIHPNNRRRVLRAIDAAKQGNKISENKTGTKMVYDALIIALKCDRSLLYERINKRVDIMFEEGWIEEVKNLKQMGVDINKVKDIGYKEVNQFLEGYLTFEEAKEIIKQKTRNYAKRQMTWFKNKMDCVFVEVDYENPGNTLQEVTKLIEKFLKS